MIFNEKYTKILDIVRDDIEKINLLNCIQEPLKSKLSRILNAPSKHIRPLISFLYLKALGAEVDEKQIQYQTAIEFVHNASLIHDDVIDESIERRGVETLNYKLGNKMAVIMGDYLLSVAMKKVLNLSIPQLIEMFCETLEIMSFGEINQNLNKFKIPTIDEYIKKSEQKTAKLFETAIDGAVIINNCSGFENNEILRFAQNDKEVFHKNFAKNFGIAFQIRDDLINCLTSKSDIEEGIYTAPVIYSEGLEITEFGIEKTQDLLNNYLDLALNSLENLEDSIYKSALVELVGLLRNE